MKSLSLKANYCTIELSTGSMIEIMESPARVLELRAKHLGTDNAIQLPLVVGSGRSDADYREHGFFVPEQIAAVYPLDEIVLKRF